MRQRSNGEYRQSQNYGRGRDEDRDYRDNQNDMDFVRDDDDSSYNENGSPSSRSSFSGSQRPPSRGSEPGWRERGSGGASFDEPTYGQNSRNYPGESYGRHQGDGRYQSHRDYGPPPQDWGHAYSQQSQNTPQTAASSSSRGSFVGKGPKGYKRSDDRIKEDVCDALEAAPNVDASEIEVDVKDGQVTLTGTVTERRMKREAEEVVEHLRGVSDVHNQIRILSSSQDSSTNLGSAAKSSTGSATSSTSSSSRSTPNKTH